MTFIEDDNKPEEKKIMLMIDADTVMKGLEKDWKKLSSMIFQYLIKNGLDANSKHRNLVMCMMLHIKDANDYLEADDMVRVDNNLKAFAIPIMFEDAVKEVTLKELRDMAFKGEIK